MNKSVVLTQTSLCALALLSSAVGFGAQSWSRVDKAVGCKMIINGAEHKETVKYNFTNYKGDNYKGDSKLPVVFPGGEPLEGKWTTPIHLFAQLAFAKGVDIAFGHSCDVNALDSEGITPLVYACVNAPDSEGITPLVYALGGVYDAKIAYEERRRHTIHLYGSVANPVVLRKEGIELEMKNLKDAFSETVCHLLRTGADPDLVTSFLSSLACSWNQDKKYYITKRLAKVLCKDSYPLNTRGFFKALEEIEWTREMGFPPDCNELIAKFVFDTSIKQA